MVFVEQQKQRASIAWVDAQTCRLSALACPYHTRTVGVATGQQLTYCILA